MSDPTITLPLPLLRDVRRMFLPKRLKMIRSAGTRRSAALDFIQAVEKAWADHLLASRIDVATAAQEDQAHA